MGQADMDHERGGSGSRELRAAAMKTRTPMTLGVGVTMPAVGHRRRIGVDRFGVIHARHR